MSLTSKPVTPQYENYWNGKKIEDCTREELIECVKWCAEERRCKTLDSSLLDQIKKRYDKPNPVLREFPIPWDKIGKTQTWFSTFELPNV